jgi:putative hydrolase of the HAD superfamily
MASIKSIAFDADDTLWHFERVYAAAREQIIKILRPHSQVPDLGDLLDKAEIDCLALYGYGIKGCILGMLEAALDISGGSLTADEISRLLAVGRSMLTADLQLVDGASEVLRRLASAYPLVLITKGDSHEQRAKIERSGLGPHFTHIEVVGEKTPQIYRELLSRYGIDPATFMMVGNSLRSDIWPVLEIGGHAVHIPAEITWEHEAVQAPSDYHNQFYKLEHVGELPALLERIHQQG